LSGIAIGAFGAKHVKPRRRKIVHQMGARFADLLSACF
jgi:hypothetical protein